jgi:hypothetical protein
LVDHHITRSGDFRVTFGWHPCHDGRMGGRPVRIQLTGDPLSGGHLSAELVDCCL